MEKVTVSDWNLSEEINTREDVIGILDKNADNDSMAYSINALHIS